MVLLAACVSPQMHSTLQHAGIRLFVQTWDSWDGTIAWEGVQKLNYASDAASEKDVTFKTVVEETARNLIARLP